MKELIEIYKIIDENLCKSKSLKKIEKILNNNESFMRLGDKDKEHIINYINKNISNYINKEINDIEMKRKLETKKVIPSKKTSKNIIINDELENLDDSIKNKKFKEIIFCDETEESVNNKKKLEKEQEKNKQELKEEGEKLSSIGKAIILSKISKEEYDRKKNIYEVLEKIILPVQRSVEWFSMRNEKITASDAGCVVGLNKYEHVYKFVHKKVYGSTFKTNQACYHGKKLEEPVTLMYEYTNDVKVKEFGLLGDSEYSFLGASPDGICSPYKRNGKTKSDLVGRMLEIKCPLFRKIKFKGEIIDNICPVYYWCQVQNQLRCCNLDECDFVQCNLEEYGSKEEWIEDTSDEHYYFGKKYGKERGVLIEFIPVDLYVDKEEDKKKQIKDKKDNGFDTDSEDDDEDDKDNDENIYGEGYDKEGKIKLNRIYDKTIFKYQPKIDMTEKQMDTWITKTTKGYRNIYDIRQEQIDGTFNKDKNEEIAVHRIIYWRLKERNTTLIKRDIKWFDNNLPKYEKVWNYVLILRNDKVKRKQWKKNVKMKEKEFNKRKFNNYYAEKMANKEFGDELLEDLLKIIDKN
jgi:putative phage-type endonuclease